MKNIDNVLHYTTKESALLLGISYQTLYNYIKYNELLKSKDKPKIIPEPLILNETYYFSETDIKKIFEAKKHFKKGMFKQFKQVGGDKA